MTDNLKGNNIPINKSCLVRRYPKVQKLFVKPDTPHI